MRKPLTPRPEAPHARAVSFEPSRATRGRVGRRVASPVRDIELPANDKHVHAMRPQQRGVPRRVRQRTGSRSCRAFTLPSLAEPQWDHFPDVSCDPRVSSA